MIALDYMYICTHIIDKTTEYITALILIFKGLFSDVRMIFFHRQIKIWPTGCRVQHKERFPESWGERDTTMCWKKHTTSTTNQLGEVKHTKRRKQNSRNSDETQ